MGSVSGAHNFLFAPGVDPGPAGSAVGVQPPAPVPYVHPHEAMAYQILRREAEALIGSGTVPPGK